MKTGARGYYFISVAFYAPLETKITVTSRSKTQLHLLRIYL